MHIKVFHRPLPKSLRDHQPRLKLDSRYDEEYKLRDQLGVDPVRIGQTHYIMTDGYILKHIDWEEVSILWVVRNDTNSWVWSHGHPSVKEQPRETL